jgi:hypothetical protein
VVAFAAGALVVSVGARRFGVGRMLHGERAATRRVALFDERQARACGALQRISRCGDRVLARRRVTGVRAAAMTCRRRACSAAAGTAAAPATTTAAATSATTALIADEHIGASLDELAISSAVLVSVADPMGRFAIDEHALRAALGGPQIGSAASRVDAKVTDAQRRFAIRVDRGRALHRRADRDVRAGRAAVRVGWTLRLVTEATKRWHRPPLVPHRQGGDNRFCASHNPTFAEQPIDLGTPPRSTSRLDSSRDRVGP